MSKTKEYSTSGKDSPLKMMVRNLSGRRIKKLAGRARNAVSVGGFAALWRAGAMRLRLMFNREVWRYRVDIPYPKELKEQKKHRFASMPLVSVVVPLYNTRQRFLGEMIESVQAQSYGNWQLMLVDGSDEGHEYVADICHKYARKDGRIKYVRLFKNAGISRNTNIGLAECEGDWIALLDHDDLLQPGALYEVVKAHNEHGADLVFSDEAILTEDLRGLGAYHLKPCYGPDTLRGCNYMTHLCAFSRELLDAAGGGEREEYDGAQDFDFILRLSEQAKVVYHIPKVLYFWRQSENSTAVDISVKPEAMQAGERALQDHLARVRLSGRAEARSGNYSGSYRVHYDVWGSPMVSVLIPSKDHIDDLDRCLETLYECAGWEPMEVLVLDNNSQDIATESFYEEIEGKYEGLRVLRYPGEFNFAAICNFGAERAKGEHLLLLNNDIEILTQGFVREMLGYSQRPDVGAVGAKLYYPDDTVQHAGLFVGIGGCAGVSHKGAPRGDGGNLFRLSTTQNMSAVTGAALMVKKALYDEIGGMDEENFAVAFNDVDFCLRLWEKGYWNVFTPFAEAYHYESKSRGYDTEGEKKTRFEREKANFQKRHAGILEAGDPFYNPHLTLEAENYAMK